jgi:hypothetical protein
MVLTVVNRIDGGTVIDIARPFTQFGSWNCLASRITWRCSVCSLMAAQTRPERDGDLSEFMRWLTLTHTQPCHAKHHTEGTGLLYQGRFKAFLVAKNEHCLRVLRYVERNPLRAGWREVRGDGVGAAWAERRLDCQARRCRRARSRNQSLGKSGGINRKPRQS